MTTATKHTNGKQIELADGIFGQEETVTPQLADLYLQNMGPQRHLYKGVVEQYADDMRNGYWVPHHQGIGFDQEGRLRDGQHRLNAVKLAGVAVRMMVFRNVPGEWFDRIDRGRGRGIPDVLAMYHGIKNAKQKSPAVNLIAEVLGIPSRTLHQNLSLVQRLDADFDHIIMLTEGKVKPVAAALAFARRKDPDRIDEFAVRFTSGVGLVDGDPALMLRNVLMSDFASGRKNLRVANFLRTLCAAHAYVTGRKTRVVKPSQQALKYFKAAHADWAV